MVYKSQLIGYKKPTDHQNLSVFQLPYENQPFELSSFLTVSVFGFAASIFDIAILYKARKVEILYFFRKLQAKHGGKKVGIEDASLVAVCGKTFERFPAR